MFGRFFAYKRIDGDYDKQASRNAYRGKPHLYAYVRSYRQQHCCDRQKGFTDERGNLFFEVGKVIDAKQPKIVFLENVANLTEHDNGKTFNIIHNELAGRGYYIRYIIADACDYGIPQHRTRTYIVAFKDKTACDNFRFPEKVPLEKHITDIIDTSVKADARYYYSLDEPKFARLQKAIVDDKQLYRFSDWGIQSIEHLSVFQQ